MYSIQTMLVRGSVTLLGYATLMTLILPSQGQQIRVPDSQPTGAFAQFYSDTVTPLPDPIDTLIQSQKHAIFTKLLAQSGMMREIIADPTAYTIYAPTNASIISIAQQSSSINILMSDQAQIDQFISSHVFTTPLQLSDTQRTGLQRIPTTQGILYSLTYSEL